MDNCNCNELLKEISPGEVPNQHMQINYKSTLDNKCETTRAKNTIKRKVSQSSKRCREKTARMSGEGQYRELDAEGRKIINDLIVADKDRTLWPENTEPKFTRNKGAKLIKVAFNTKSKKYTHAYEEKEEVPVEEAIRLDISDAHIYFCFHPTKNEYVLID